MSTGWASPRDEFPDSVHALMSLWGGFVNPTSASSDSGLEKRLELDFRVPINTEVVSVAALEEAMSAAEQYLEHHMEERPLFGLKFTDSMLVLSPSNIVVSSASCVMLHRVLQPLLQLLRTMDIEVEWASYLRKNMNSPWATTCETSDIMAQEYAQLQANFQRGKSFLTGPVDGDHFFHFVYDDIDRTTDRVEDDVLFNLLLCDIQGVGGKDAQKLRLLPNGEYEMLRVFSNHNYVSFETSAKSAVVCKERVQSLLYEFRPSRFTVVAMQDKDTDVNSIRTYLSQFEGYTAQNSSVNFFGEGYAFHQVVFALCE